MTKPYAVIEFGVVANMALADIPLGPNWVDVSNVNPRPGVGWAYDGANFTAPAAPVDTRPRWITEGAFKDRLGFALVAGIANSTNAICQGLIQVLANRKYVDLDRPDLPTMLGLLVSNNLPVAVPGIPGSGPITAAQVQAVLTNPVLDSERP